MINVSENGLFIPYPPNINGKTHVFITAIDGDIEDSVFLEKQNNGFFVKIYNNKLSKYIARKINYSVMKKAA